MVRIAAWILAAGAVSMASPMALAQRQISAEAYLDKLQGMWLGQVLGNYAGRGQVPGTTSNREGYVLRGGASFDVGWSDLLAVTTWVGDDDTTLECMYLDLLGRRTDPDASDIRATWMDNIAADTYYIANRQARWLMEPAPVGANLSPPATGSLHHNMHWYAIDAQIATESLGAAAPGMRQRAADLVGRLAAVSNDGYPIHAAQFYAAMYAAAALELPADGVMERVVEQGLAVVPATSRTHEVIDDVLACYEADRAAGRLADADAWRDCQRMLYDRYGTYAGSQYRYRYWIESTVNVGLTTMALLYGGGDYTRTVEIGVLGGYDADCNPATAGGLVGLIRGFRGPDGGGGILAELPATPADAYDTRSLRACGKLTTLSQVAADFLAAAEAQTIACGGAVEGQGSSRVFLLPADAVASPLERPDPPGPSRLVGRVLAAGGRVAVAASVERHNAGNDRQNLDAIIDGITDVSYNGHLPYTTDDGANAQPAGGDWYELIFERPMTFRSLVFHEGDIAWANINSNPRVVEPLGGFFLGLGVEVFADGAYRPVEGLHLSEELDPNVYFQRIELTFEPAVGDRIRIRGPSGGTNQFTSILELEAEGAMGTPGDADEDGDVDRDDLLALKAGMALGAGAWQSGDFDFDGDVDVLDYIAMKRYYGSDMPAGHLPEPSAAALLVAAAVCLLRSRRAR